MPREHALPGRNLGRNMVQAADNDDQEDRNHLDRSATELLPLGLAVRVVPAVCGMHLAASLLQLFLKNIFPGNCRISRFISRLSSATDAAELGRPLFRITSSILISSLLRVS